MPGPGARVFGPYPSGGKWRVVCVLDGVRKAQIFASQDQAQAACESLRASMLPSAGRRVAEVLDEYLAEKRRQGLRPLSLRNLDCKLRRYLDPTASLGSLDADAAQALYQAWTGTLAVATHRMLLRYVRGFFAWCVERRYLAHSPFAQVKPVGKPRHGKPQLRIDEARRLYRHLLSQAQAGEDAALGLLLLLLLGLRSGEVHALRARDVDADASRLCVAMGDYAGKTAHAPRSLRVEAPELRALLHRRRLTCADGQPLLGGPRGLGQKALRSHLHRACQQLGLLPVCPHSLRGLHASLAVESGAPVAQVAAALGHGSPDVTQRHYLAADSAPVASARSLLRLLAPSPTADSAPPAEVKLPPDGSRAALVLALLQSLPPEERDAVLAALDRTG